MCHPTKEHLADRPALLSRYRAALEQAAAGSSAQQQQQQQQPYLADSLRRARRVVIFGPSDMEDVANAAWCELLRSGAVDAFDSLLFLREDRDERIRDSYETLARLLGEWASTGGGTVIASFGFHYNEPDPTIGQGLGNWGTVGAVEGANGVRYVEAFTVFTRQRFETDLTRAMALLNDFGSMCTNCHSIWATTPLQHFETPYGTWSPSIFNTTGYGCKDAPPIEQIDPRSANHWRWADPMRLAAERFPYVLTLPMHKVSTLWHAAHPGTAAGSGTTGTPGYTEKRAGRKSLTDCTHQCYSPFLYEVWWLALRAVFE